MKAGIVLISPHLICEALGFPPDWRIEDMTMDPRNKEIETTISGSDFPDMPAGSDPRKCIIIVHEKQRTFEVKEISAENGQNWP